MTLRGLLLGLLFFAFLPAVSAQDVVDACPGGKGHRIRLFKRDHAMHRKRGERIDNDGFHGEKRKGQSKGARAEGRKPKGADESKLERRWHLFRKQRADNELAHHEEKNLFVRKSSRREERRQRKKAKHPEIGLFPKDVH